MNNRPAPPIVPPIARRESADEGVEVAKKSTPLANYNNFEEESVIIEPSLDPLDTSFH